MSYEDRVKQIQNGLQIVELVNEIRANNKPKPTYGRSAISLPSTKDRTSAWELFHQVASDANGHEERTNKEGDDPVERGNVRGIEYDNDDSSGRGERSFKEANWDESDNIILENPLAANIHKDDTRRESTNGIINNKNDVSKCDNTHRGIQSNGGAQNDQTGVSSILKSGLPTDRDAQGSNNKTKHQMNPYAQEYIPKWSTNTTNNAVESKEERGIIESGNSKDQSSMIKPMMQKKILDCDKYPGVIENVKLTPIPKQRGSIMKRMDMNIEPIESGDESEDDDDDDQVVPETGEQDIDNLERNLTLSSSQETLFNISDYETDNERRNRWSLKPVRTLSESDSTGETKDEMAEKKSKMETPNPDDKPKEGRKLRALQSTNAGKEEQPGKETGGLRDIKKGTVENTAYLGMVQKSKSKNGAIQPVPQSEQNRHEKNAPVTSALQNALKKDALKSDTRQRMSSKSDNDDSLLTDSSNNSLTFDDYFQKLTNTMTTDDILKEIYKSQLEILTNITEKESLILVIRELQNIQKSTVSKIESLERNIGKLGLAVSSMEQMLSSMRIMIPGKPEETQNNTKPKNPLLKPVIGRETLKPEEVIDITVDSEGNMKASAQKRLLIEPIDDKRTNASQFIPENDNSTINTLYGLVINRIKDKELRDAFLNALKMVKTKDEIEILYTNIIKAVRAGI